RNVQLYNWPADSAGWAKVPRRVAGLHVMVKVDSVARVQELIAKANGVGVEMNALSDYWLPASTEPVDNRAGLVLGFAAVPEDEMVEALNRLSEDWFE
ncbi:PLP-dependent aminotransferase family protein, partial [Pseudomonas syringae]